MPHARAGICAVGGRSSLDPRRRSILVGSAPGKAGSTPGRSIHVGGAPSAQGRPDPRREGRSAPEELDPCRRSSKERGAAAAKHESPRAAAASSGPTHVAPAVAARWARKVAAARNFARERERERGRVGLGRRPEGERSAAEEGVRS
jgi:hypothetical protein